MKKSFILALLSLTALVSCGGTSSSISNKPSSTTSTRPTATSVDYNLVETNINDFMFAPVEGGYKITRYSYKNKSTTRVVIPETYLDEKVVEIADSSFAYASGIKKVVVSKNIERIGVSAFETCSTLVSVEVDENNNVYASQGGTLYTKDKKTLLCCPEGVETITIPSSVETLGEKAFYRSLVKNVTLQDGLRTIGDACFSYTKKLKTLTIPNTVESIGDSLFERASEIAEVTLSTSLSVLPYRTFTGCQKLKNIYIPGNIKVIEDQAITDNDYLEKVVFDDGVESIGEYSCIRNVFLKEVVLPASLKSIDNYAFDSNDRLTSIVLPEGLKTIGNNAFSMCPSLPSLNIPSTVTSIGEGIVANNYKLKTIEVSEANQLFKSDNGVLFSKDGKRLLAYPANKDGYSYDVPQGVETIDKETFSYCIRLCYQDEEEGINGTLSLPNSLKSIGIKAFCYSAHIKSITFNGTAQEFNAIKQTDYEDGEAFTCFDLSSVGTIVCSDKTITLR